MVLSWKPQKYWRRAAGILIVSVLAVVLTTLVYQSRVRALHTAESANIEAIARLKAHGLADVRRERMIDATVVSNRPMFGAAYAAWLAAPTVAGAEQLLQELAALKSTGVYTNIVLFDSAGQERLSVYPDRLLLRCAATDELLAQALAAGRPLLGDVHRCEPGGPPLWEIAAPLLVQRGDSSQPVGAILLSVDVPNALFPHIAEWPVPNITSGELILAERQGDTVVNLSNYRNSGPAALDFRAPITQTGLPIVQAMLKESGSAISRDYRGVEVMAGMAQVPESPWRVLAKMDMAEIDKPLASQVGLYMLAAAFVAILGVALLALLELLLRQRTLRKLYAAEQAQRQSERKFTAFFHSSPVAMSVTQVQDGRLVDANEAFLELFEYSREELLGPNAVEIDALTTAKRAAILAAAEEGKQIEMVVAQKSGEPRDCLLAAELLEMDEGHFLLVSAVDLTERKQAEEQLRQSEEKFRTLFERATDGITILQRHDGQSYFSDVNEGVCTILGRLRAEIVGARAADFMLEIPTESRMRAAEQVAEYGSSALECQALRADGSTVPIEITVTPLTNDRLLVIMRNIADNRRLEAELRISEERLRFALEASGEGLWDRNLVTGESYASPALYALLGHHTDENIANFWMSTLYPDDAPVIVQAVEECAQGRHLGFRHEHRIITPSGEVRWVLSAGKVVYWDTGGKPLRMVGTLKDITERRRAQEMLAASQAMYQLLAENSVDVVSLADAHGNVLYSSPANTRRLGYSEDEFKSLDLPSILQLIHPDDRGAISAILQHDIAHKLPTTTYDYRIRTKSGDYLWLEDRLRRQFDEHGELFRTIISSRDITERKQVELALVESERRYRELYDKSPDMYFTMNTVEHRITDCNLTLLQTLGYTREEVIGAASETLFDPAVPAEVVAQLGPRLPLQQVTQLDTRLRRKDGTTLDVLLSVVREEDPDGGPVLGRITLHDISERKRMENELRDSEERFRLMTEIAPVALTFSRMSDGMILYANPKAVEMVGLPAETIIGTNSGSYYQLDPEQRAQIITEMRNAGTVRNVELHVGLPGTEPMWILYSAAMGNYHGEAVILTMLYDITERKQLQDALHESEQALRIANEALERRVAERTTELRRAVNELEQANAGKDAFLAAISHELRTPLMGILSMSELLTAEIYGPLDPRQARSVAMIYESGQRLLSTVNSVLLYTGLMAGKTKFTVQPCRMAELCAIAVHAVMPSAQRKQQRLTQVVEPLELVLESDAQSIINILKMLLENAVKFTPEGGSIDACITEETPGKAVRIVVTDTGIGMSEEQVADLFQPFSQADKTLARRFEGIGIGLAYVHEVIKRLGGTISVQSELGAGSRIAVILPGAQIAA